MKYKTILKSFLLLMLIYLFSSSVSASEIIGNLSSSGATSSQINNNSFSNSETPLTTLESTKTLDNGIMAGIVSGGISRDDTEGKDKPFYSDGTALRPLPRNLAFGFSSNESTSDRETESGSVVDESTQVASALGAFDSFSTGSWFWIILLTLLLSIGIVYMYKGSMGKSKEKIL